MQCIRCGRKIKKTNVYCPYCGAAVSGTVTANHKSKKGIIVLSLFVSLFLCVVGFGVGWYLDRQNIQNYIGTEKGTALTEEEAENILLSDISDEDWGIFEDSNEKLSQIVSKYSDENGYIETDKIDTVINAFAKQVNRLYEQDIVTYYYVDENTVYFVYDCGLSAFYIPLVDGVLAGSGDNVELAAYTYGIVDGEVDFTSVQAGEIIDSSISAVDKTDYGIANVDLNVYQDSDVNLDSLISSRDSEIFLYLGHGGYHSNAAYKGSVLVTGMEATHDTYKAFEKLTYNYTDDEGISVLGLGWLDAAGIQASIGTVNYWAITANFVKDALTMDEGLVFLGACESGHNNELANAFVSVGAETIFYVKDGSILNWSASRMLYYVMQYMSGDKDGIYYTAKEALDYASEDIYAEFSNSGGIKWKLTNGDGKTISGYANTLEEWMDGSGFSGYVDIYGDSNTDYKNYTLISSVRGTVEFDDALTDKEIEDTLSLLTVRLTSEDGEYKNFDLLDTDFFINKINPGTYTIALYEEGNQIGEAVNIEIKSHRYTEVTLKYSVLVNLEGYVYDKDGEPLSNVSVVAALTQRGANYNETQTDENGYYCLEVLGENDYTLAYSKSGYEEQENQITVTYAMLEDSRQGRTYLLDDVVLTADESESGSYWIVFYEGYRDSRIELSTIDSTLAREDLYIIWDKSLEINDSSESGKCKQYYLEDGEWIYMREYGRLSDWATDIIASNLDIYDGDGNLIMEASPDTVLDSSY